MTNQIFLRSARFPTWTQTRHLHGSPAGFFFAGMTILPLVGRECPDGIKTIYGCHVAKGRIYLLGVVDYSSDEDEIIDCLEKTWARRERKGRNVPKIYRQLHSFFHN